MERLELQVNLREATGKGVARRLRAAGEIPAILYGSGTDAVSLRVSSRAVERLAGTNQIIDLRGPAQVQGKLVLLKEFQRDPLSRNVLHADFYAVDTTQKIDTHVPLHFEGRPIGVEQGGVFEAVLREVEIRCLPLAIPAVLNVSVAGLAIDDAISARDIVLPDGVELVTEENAPVAHVLAPRLSTDEEGEGGEAGDKAEASGDGDGS